MVGRSFFLPLLLTSLVLLFSLGAFIMVYETGEQKPIQPTESKVIAVTTTAATSQSQSSMGDLDIVVGLRTGKETLHRAQVQLQTFLKGHDKIVVFSDQGGELEGFKIHDVVTNLPYMSSINKRDNGTNPLDDIKPVGGTFGMKGWERDAHKFLPGLKLLYEKHPNSKWYIILDDDAFVNLVSLSHFLKGHDSDKEHYLGNAFVFSGCVDYEPKPAFAHGGPGIIISNGAMKKIQTVVDTCIPKYKDCWAGDIRVAICMKDANIYASGGKMQFNEGPDVVFYDQDPCESPNTFHKMSLNQIRKLDKLMRDSNFKPTMADVFREFRGYNHSSVIPKMDYEIGGDPFKKRTTEDEFGCMVACIEDAECASFSFWVEKKQCSLKRRPGRQEEKKGYASGYIGERYKCVPAS
ncbi:hypothetical protein BCR33DRAFT_715018 [Rhizoclosmatium globosum]|uniref:N-acetylgalactosaminide beta-1,3-galactosyltransferase n=1 Tax=Rhizoclosmatium globosum TaxID=329046 RepID=A0A1Y2CJV3_9FUNG|nr:hypothetical protein BCR33DRAFT_715018 [Rhizoclosmatium globosum]|eukprot:ORY47266.1 hypothetical protein BCR33DRAFT_715018 [Rhizoclosmatium globosum]